MIARLFAVICAWATVALGGCEPSRPPLPDTGPQTAAVVACLLTDIHGNALDSFIINSSGDPEAVKQILAFMMWDGRRDLDLRYAGWGVVEYHQKNGPMLPLPKGCGPHNQRHA